MSQSLTVKENELQLRRMTCKSEPDLREPWLPLHTMLLHTFLSPYFCPQVLIFTGW